MAATSPGSAALSPPGAHPSPDAHGSPGSTGRAAVAGTPGMSFPPSEGAPTPPALVHMAVGHGKPDALGGVKPDTATKPVREASVSFNIKEQSQTQPQPQPPPASHPLSAAPPVPPSAPPFLLAPASHGAPSEEMGHAFQLILEQLLPAIHSAADALFDALAVPPSPSPAPGPAQPAGVSTALLSSAPALPEKAAATAAQLHTFLSSLLQVLQLHGMAGLPILPVAHTSAPADPDAMQVDPLPSGAEVPHDLPSATEQWAARAKREFEKAQRLRDASEIVRDVLAGVRVAQPAAQEKPAPHAARRARSSLGPNASREPPSKRSRGSTPALGGAFKQTSAQSTPMPSAPSSGVQSKASSPQP